MAKIKIDSALLDRAKAAADAAGYSSVDEFITHAIEEALVKLESAPADADQAVEDRLRGLGYIE